MSQHTISQTIEVRNFICFNRDAVLSTISQSQQGFPFGSLVPYDISTDGSIIIYVSLIAEHYKNLTVDSRGSITVIEPFATQHRQASARATILANFNLVPESELPGVQRAYELRFPKSVNYEIQHNFVFLRGIPIKIRWIGGFGDIAWIKADDFFKASADPLAYIGLGIVEHMNDDHMDALRDLVKAFSAFDPGQYQIQMVDITSTDFCIALKGHGKLEKLKINFPQPIQNAEEARKEIIELLKRARKQLSN